MARPRSDEKRIAILDASIRIFVTQGLAAPTAGIAKAAGVANGTFFTYFETKADLLNQLYLELKREMASAALKDFPAKAALRTQCQHIWRSWMHYAATHPDKRRVLMQLAVSSELTPETRAEAAQLMRPLGEQFERMRAKGPLRKASPAFAAAIMTAIAEATMESMIQDPARAAETCDLSFETLWRAIS
jgi:AcrR family transcriptional regulator